MGKKMKKKQTEAAKEEAEAEEDAELNQMLAEFKQDDIELPINQCSDVTGPARPT